MEKIETCKKCKKRKFDFQQGIICSLTNEKPNFTPTCPDFENDENNNEYKGLNTKPNEQRGKTAIFLIWVILGLEILSLISSALQYDLLSSIANGKEITIDAANANDTREAIIAMLFLIAYIISGITFIMWFRRAYFNLHQKVKTLSFSEGWAAGSWFVPIVNLYRPFQIMKELYEKTKYLLKNKNESIQLEFKTNLLGIWWGLWILNNFYGQITYRLFKDANTISDFLTSTTLDMIGSVLGIILAFITVRVIKDYTKYEELLQD